MKNRKRDKASGVYSTKSKNARAMRVRMPKVWEYFVPQIAEQITVSYLASNQTIIAAPPTKTSQELQIVSTSAPQEALQQILPRSGKLTRKSPKF